MFKKLLYGIEKKIFSKISLDKTASTTVFQLTIINHVNIKGKVRKKQQ